MKTGSNQRRVTMLSYFYPPVKAVGTLRNHYIAQLFAEQNYDVTVYGGRPLGYRDRDTFTISDAVNVKRTLAIDYHLFDKLRKRKKGGTASTVKESRSHSIPWISYFPFNFLVGEGGLLYSVLLFFRLLFRIAEIDIIWSSYSPIADHYVASLIKRLRPSIFWITDWRDVDVDPDWPDTPATARQRKINKAIIKNCDLVVSVSDSYMKYVQHYSDRHYLLRNGIMEKFDASGQQLDRKFTISYVGGLYGGRRDPSLLFEQVADLINAGSIAREDVSLVYAGREGGVYRSIAERYGIADLVDDRGVVSFSTSQEIQRSAQINLMISWASSSMSTFPAKFYEYVNARRPIYLLVLGVRDQEFESIFSTKGIGHMFYQDQDSTLSSTLLDAYKCWLENGAVPYVSKESEVEEFYWRESFRSFAEFLDKLLRYET